MQKAYAQLYTEKERKEVPLLLHVGRYALEEFTTSLTVWTSISIKFYFCVVFMHYCSRNERKFHTLLEAWVFGDVFLIEYEWKVVSWKYFFAELSSSLVLIRPQVNP